jgi:hypothetical protein
MAQWTEHTAIHENSLRIGLFKIVDNIRAGVVITSATKDALCKVLMCSRRQIVEAEPVDNVEVLSEAIFVLDCAPSIVFKIADDSGRKNTMERWKHVKRASDICAQQNLDLLILPAQSLIEIRTGSKPYYIIAEQRLSLPNNHLIHARRYEASASRLDPALKQLVAFIAASGFRDLDFRNIPIANESSSDMWPKIALVDLENCGDIDGQTAPRTYAFAFFGNGRSIRGLFRCIMPQSFPAVRDAASRHHIDLELCEPWGYATALRDRTLELGAAARIRQQIDNAAAYEGEVTNLVELVSKSLLGGVCPHFQLVTEPLDEFDRRQHLLFVAARRFKVEAGGQKALSLRGVLVLHPENSSRLALTMLIQGSSASSVEDVSILRQDLEAHFGETWDKPVLKRLPDGDGFGFQISTASPARDDEEARRWMELRRLSLNRLSLFLGFQR